MSLLFNRYAKVSIDGRELTSPPFSIEFEIEFKEKGVPVSKIKLYNPAPETILKAKPKREKGKNILPAIEIEAGFKNDHGTCLIGEIIGCKEDFKRPDRILHIDASDTSSKIANFGIHDTYQNITTMEVIEDMCKKAGVEIKTLEPGINRFYERVRVSTFLKEIEWFAKNTESRFTIQYNRLIFESEDNKLGTAILLNEKTGLLDIPEVLVKRQKKTKEVKGRYKVKSLFRYDIQNGGLLKVEWGNRKSEELKILSGKHIFSSFGNCYTMVECETL